MKRIYVCIGIVVLLLAAAFYSSFRVQQFAEDISEDIDTAMKLGANHPMGPLALADLIGLDVCLAIMELLRDEMGEGKYRPAPLLRKLVRAGRLGRKSGEGFFRY